MTRFVEGEERSQSVLFPERLEDWISENNPVRVVDVFVDELDLKALGFERATAAETGRPGYHPAIRGDRRDQVAPDPKTGPTRLPSIDAKRRVWLPCAPRLGDTETSPEQRSAIFPGAHGAAKPWWPGATR